MLTLVKPCIQRYTTANNQNRYRVRKEYKGKEYSLVFRNLKMATSFRNRFDEFVKQYSNLMDSDIKNFMKTFTK